VDFSKIIECDRAYLSKIVNGKLKPSKRLAKDIEEATNGEVTASELLEEK
jgi:DNA-binding transcriptional regulator YdaS (Cro superfamily)